MIDLKKCLCKNHPKLPCKYSLILAILVSLVPIITFSQTQTNTTIEYLRDSVKKFSLATKDRVRKDSLEAKYLSEDAYEYYYDRYFSLINYQRESFADGNSAALKIAEDKTSLNLTLAKKTRSNILSVTTALNIKDNSGTLFTGSKPTTGTEFGFNWSHLILNWRKLFYDNETRFVNYALRREMADSLYRLYFLKNPNLLKPLTVKLHKKDSLIKLYANKIDSAKIVDHKTGKLLVKPDSLNALQELLTNTIDEKEKLIQQMKSLSYIEDQEDVLREIKKQFEDKRIAKEIATDGVTQFRMVWTSGGITYHKDTYKTYDGSLSVSSRVGEQAFDGWGLNLGLNFYFQKSPKWIEFTRSKFFNSIYSAVTYSVSGGNSFTGIDETSYSVIKSSASNDTTFQLTNTAKLRDITDVKFTTFAVHKVGVQFTGMMGQKQFFGVNLSANIESSKEKGTTSNARLGLLFRFIDSADQKSKVNFELFLALNDFNNINKSKQKEVWNRRQIGVSVSVPFQKIFFK